jgi:hypothetical protein
VKRDAAKRGHGKAGIAQNFAHAEFVAARFNAGRMIVHDSQGTRDVSSGGPGTIADGEHTVDGCFALRLQHRMCRRLSVLEVNANRSIVPGIVETIAAIGYENQIDAELFRSNIEHARLVAEFRGEQ